MIGSALLLSAYRTSVRAAVIGVLPEGLRARLPIATRSAPLAAQAA